MYEWNVSIQKMIDWIEENIKENPTLLEMSKQIGYSPYYCSSQFHAIVGMTLKSYVAGRKLAHATISLRDSNERIIDIAIQYGFSSQEAFTRAFVGAYGCTPAAYRKNQRPIPLSIKQAVLHPYHFENNNKGAISMGKVAMKIEYLPAHKYVGIWDKRAHNYSEFWDYHDCDEVCGIIESMRNVASLVIGSHMAGWTKIDSNGERYYFYGFGVPVDYTGPIPEGFEIKEFPESYYLVFFHPQFDYLADNGEIMSAVEDMAWNFNIKDKSKFDKFLIQSGFEWNEDVCQDYQKHYPEVLGYEVLRPVKKIR